MNKNLRRTSPRVSVSMQPATYHALVAQAREQGVAVSHLAARILGSGVDPGPPPDSLEPEPRR